MKEKTKSSRLRWIVVAAVCVLVTPALLLTSCDNLFGSDSDETTHADGTLTVQLLDGGNNPCPVDLVLPGPDGTPVEHSFPVFAVWVYPAGSTDDNGYVAFGSATFDQGSNSIVNINARDSDNEWQGTGGARYDVYPTVYCTIDGSMDHFEVHHDNWEDAWAAVHKGHGSQDWGVPVSYTQNGNQTVATVGNDYGRLLIDTVTVRVTDIPVRDPDPFQAFYVRVFEAGVTPGEHNALAGNGEPFSGETAELIMHTDEHGNEWEATPGETYQVLLMLFGAASAGGPEAEGSRHLFFTYTQYADGMELAKPFVDTGDGAWGDPDNLQF